MPNIQSAKKALRQSARRRANNLKRQGEYKKAIKSYLKLIAEKNKEAAAKLLPRVFKALDKAAKTKVIKKNKASRLKSRLAAKIK